MLEEGDKDTTRVFLFFFNASKEFNTDFISTASQVLRSATDSIDLY